MIIYLNNAEREIQEGITCADLMQQASNPTGAASALIWVNGTQVPKDKMETIVLQDGDKVNIIGGFNYGG